MPNDLSQQHLGLDAERMSFLRSHMAYIEWGTPNYVGHKWVFYDLNAGMEWDPEAEGDVPLPRWKAGRCIRSASTFAGKTALPQNEEERFEDLGTALDWLMEPLPKGAR